MTYDPNNVKVSWGGTYITTLAEDAVITYSAEKIPLDLTVQLKDIGKVEGTVYLTPEQFDTFNNKYKDKQ